MPKISIIVPVYNVETYLPNCLDSIITQTCEDIEIILIDDGSTDMSGNICDEYVAKDPRFSVIHKQNEGLSAARNDGIKVSSAEYILFVDSDDWVEKELCEKTVYLAKKHNADLILFAYCERYRDGKSKKTNPDLKTGLLSEKEALFFTTQFAPAIWLGLYRRELFTTICFPNGKIHEDYGTSHRLIHEANKIYFLNENLYNYRIGRPGSIETEEETRNHVDLKEMMLRRINDLVEWGYEEYVRNDAMTLLIRYGFSGLEYLINIVKKGSSYYSLKQKTLLILLRFSPALFDLVCISMRKRKK